MDKLYTMKLGERIAVDSLLVWRVPGGWIFGASNGEGGVAITFVPYTEEIKA